MDALSTYIIGALSAIGALVINYVVARLTHSGNVKISDAETIFKASESVRNDLATELLACRKDRDHYIDLYNKCLEGNRD